MSLGTVLSRPQADRQPSTRAVLRDVVATANARRDGVLPTDVRGVSASFPATLDLVAALQLRWHTRLAGNIERALSEQPFDLERAVLCAWSRTARELVGVRLVLDRLSDAPVDDATATALRKAQVKEWAMLAVMSGQAGVHDEQAPDLGRILELMARATFDPASRPAPRPTARSHAGARKAERRGGLLRGQIARFRDLVAA